MSHKTLMEKMTIPIYYTRVTGRKKCYKLLLPTKVLNPLFCLIYNYLTDFYMSKSKTKLVKNCTLWRLNPRPLDHHSNAILIVLACACWLEDISEVSFAAYPTSHFGFWSFLKSIEHNFIRAVTIQAGN